MIKHQCTVDIPFSPLCHVKVKVRQSILAFAFIIYTFLLFLSGVSGKRKGAGEKIITLSTSCRQETELSRERDGISSKLVYSENIFLVS